MNGIGIRQPLEPIVDNISQGLENGGVNALVEKFHVFGAVFHHIRQ